MKFDKIYLCKLWKGCCYRVKRYIIKIVNKVKDKISDNIKIKISIVIAYVLILLVVVVAGTVYSSKINEKYASVKDNLKVKKK